MTSRTIVSWYLHSIDYSKAPRSLAELEATFAPLHIKPHALREEAKWEPLLRGQSIELPSGWVRLRTLADTRRGIATGSNNFFLVSRATADAAGISLRHLRECVGRAMDVKHRIFTEQDYEALVNAGGKALLIDFGNDLNDAEQRYIKLGAESGLTARFLLAARHPWYSMEQRPPAPIWASVFGRGELEFVFNEAGVRSLTNFHCVFPRIARNTFARALVAVLNSGAVRQRSMLFSRGFGGGLKKFEPRDLLDIPVPDLRFAEDETLEMLADQLERVDRRRRAGKDVDEIEAEIDAVVDHISYSTVQHAAQGMLF